MNDCTKLNHVTGKKLTVKLKYGYTIDDFTRHFNCSEEEFINFLQKNFEKTACSNMLAEMEKNSKKKNNNKKTSSAPIFPYTDEGLIVQTSDISSESQLSEIQIPVTSSLSNVEKLQHLKDEEKLLRDELISKENEHQKLIKRRKELFKKLETQHSLMLQLRKTIEQRQKEVEKISNDLNTLSDEITSVNSSLFNGRKDLFDIQKKIKDLEKISVFIYENGEIDTDNFVIDIPETWHEVFDNILRNKVVEDLSIKQVKQLAKVIVLTAILNDHLLTYELTFESEDSEKAFYELDKAMS